MGHPASGQTQTLTRIAGGRAERELLEEQAAAVKHAAELVASLRRVGRGLGVYEVDLALRVRYDGLQDGA